MHQSSFGFQRRPFPTTPDTSYYYPATNHEQALARLWQVLEGDEGLALLTAEPGIGKTLLCHRLLERLSPRFVSAYVTNSHLDDRISLLQALLYDLSLPYEGQSAQQLRLRLTDFLLVNYAAGKRTVLVVDEAQHLSPDLLEELRLLGNLEAGQGKAVQIILAAQPALLHTLRRAELAALNQRLVARVRLDPLGLEEAIDYLLHHLRGAGVRPEQVFSEEALELLARSANGVPRLLNQIGHQSLQLAQAAGAEIVDAEVVLEALAQLGLEVEEVPTHFDRLVRSDGSRCHGDSESNGAEVMLESPGEPGEEKLVADEPPQTPAYRLFEPRQPA